MNIPADEQLVMDYVGGDRKSLEILIKRYLKPIYSFVCRYVKSAHDAEDITQEVFVKMWKHIKSFDKNKKFKTWLFAIAKNASLDFLKKKMPVNFSEFEDDEGNNPIVDGLKALDHLPGEIMEKKDAEAFLASILSSMSSKYRMPLFLRYNDHFTFREIAEALGEPLHTIKSRHRRALIMLRKMHQNADTGRIRQ